MVTEAERHFWLLLEVEAEVQFSVVVVVVAQIHFLEGAVEWYLLEEVEAERLLMVEVEELHLLMEEEEVPVLQTGLAVAVVVVVGRAVEHWVLEELEDQDELAKVVNWY